MGYYFVYRDRQLVVGFTIKKKRRGQRRKLIEVSLVLVSYHMYSPTTWIPESLRGFCVDKR